MAARSPNATSRAPPRTAPLTFHSGQFWNKRNTCLARAAGAPRSLRHLPARRGRSAARGFCRRARPDKRAARPATDDGVSMTGTATRSTAHTVGDGRGVREERQCHSSRGTWRPIARLERRASTIRNATKGAARLIGASTEGMVIREKPNGKCRSISLPHSML